MDHKLFSLRIWLLALSGYLVYCTYLLSAPGDCDTDCRQVTQWSATFMSDPPCEEFQYADCDPCTSTFGGSCPNDTRAMPGTCQAAGDVPEFEQYQRGCINCSVYCGPPASIWKATCTGQGQFVGTLSPIKVCK